MLDHYTILVILGLHGCQARAPRVANDLWMQGKYNQLSTHRCLVPFTQRLMSLRQNPKSVSISLLLPFYFFPTTVCSSTSAFGGLGNLNNVPDIGKCLLGMAFIIGFLCKILAMCHCDMSQSDSNAIVT
jgi:hypothetical protein